MAAIMRLWDEDTEQFIEVPALQGRPGMAYELLWTNSDTSSAFAAQTIPADLSKHLFAMVEFSISGSTSATVCATGTIGATTVVTFNTPYQNKLRQFSRDWTVSSSGITFAGAYTTTNGGTTTLSNSILVPYRIWGVYVPPMGRDPLVEIYQDGAWTVRKWSDGTAEAFYHGDHTFVCTGQVGSVYESSGTAANQLAYPTGLFTSIFYRSIDSACNNSRYINVWHYGADALNVCNVPAINLVGTSSASATWIATVSIYVAGRWK